MGDALTQLRVAARWLLAVNLDPTTVAFKRIAFSEALVVGQAIANNPDDPIMDHLHALISDAQATGELADGDVRFLVGYLLNSIALGPTFDAMLGQTTYASVKAQDAYFEQAWSLFLNGVEVRDVWGEKEESGRQLLRYCESAALRKQPALRTCRLREEAF